MMNRELSLPHATAPANAAGTSATRDSRANTAGDGRSVVELHALVAALLGEIVQDFCSGEAANTAAAAVAAAAAGGTAPASATTGELLPQNTSCTVTSCPCDGSCQDCLPQT